MAKLLVLLADRDRLALLQTIAAVYHDLLEDRQNVVRAEVTSAEPLSPTRIRRFEQRLATVTGKRVSMTTRVDPAHHRRRRSRASAAPCTTRSIATQLKKIRERLT